VNPVEADSYHFIISADGSVTTGIPVERNRAPLVNGAYAAHTLNCNTDSIGISVDAMAGAQERPFVPGPYPITDAQLAGMIRCAAEQAKKYGIPVSRKTILSHAEVQTTLGIKQRQKWDIMWIPGMGAPGDPVRVGDVLRARIADAMLQKPAAAPRPAAGPRPAAPEAQPDGFWASLLAALRAAFTR
jgi:hypothetical protein